MKITIYKKHGQQSLIANSSNHSVEHCKKQSLELVPENIHSKEMSKGLGNIKTRMLDSEGSIIYPQTRNLSFNFKEKSLLEKEYQKRVKTELKLFVNEKKRLRLLTSKIDKSLERFRRSKFFSNQGISSAINNKILSRNLSKEATSLWNGPKEHPLKNDYDTENRIKRNYEKKRLSSQIEEKRKSEDFMSNQKTKAKAYLFLIPKKNKKEEKVMMYQSILEKRPVEEKIVPTVKKRIRDWKTDNLRYNINDLKILNLKKISLMKPEEKFKKDKYPYIGMKSLNGFIDK